MNKAGRFLVIAVVMWTLVPASHAAAQTVPSELGHGWQPEFSLTSKQLLQLAEATPDEKFTWRPAAGVRSISEVYMHLALGSLWLLEQAGGSSPVDVSKLPKEPEKNIVKKADVVRMLSTALDAVGKGYAAADRQKRVQFFGRETTADAVFLRILIHANEHMGQAIAYARMNGIVPPWSAPV